MDPKGPYKGFLVGGRSQLRRLRILQPVQIMCHGIISPSPGASASVPQGTLWHQAPAANAQAPPSADPPKSEGLGLRLSLGFRV